MDLSPLHLLSIPPPHSSTSPMPARKEHPIYAYNNP